MRKRHIKKRGFLRSLFTILPLFILLVFVTGFIVFLSITDISQWQTLEINKLTDMDQSLLVYDAQGNHVATEYSLENRMPIKVSALQEYTISAFLAAEDARFYNHFGVDPIRIMGSAVADIKSGSFSQGASTISQQVIKNTHLTRIKTMDRKINEAWLAIQLEWHFEKDEILEMYLNYVYFGNGAYGIEAAAQSYFSKSASELTMAESAMLAGVLKGPAIYAPHLDMKKSIGRRDLILDMMVKYEFISQQEANTAKHEVPELRLQRKYEKYSNYIDTALREAASILDMSLDELACSGYSIHTWLEVDKQQILESTYDNDELFPSTAEDGIIPESAMILMDSDTGHVNAMMGGREYTKFGLNRAVSSYRQPGSTIKPIVVYGPAVDRFGYTAATYLNDQPTNFNGYQPSNYGDKYYGWVTLRKAIMSSLNIPAVWVLQDIGINSTVDYAGKAGLEIKPEDQNLAIALGGFTHGVSPMTLAGTYTPFANDGIYSQPSLIDSITDYKGNILYQNQSQTNRVLSPETAYIITDILRDTARAGTARRLADVGVPLCAKTGTVAATGGIRDAWVVTYNPDYIAAVWMGYDITDAQHVMANNVTGGTYPTQLAAEVFKQIYPDGIGPDFSPPQGIVQIDLDKKSMDETQTSVLATNLTPDEYRYSEIFSQGTAPSQQSTYWTMPDSPSDVKVYLNDDNQPIIGFIGLQPFVRYDIQRRLQSQESFETLHSVSSLNGYYQWTDQSAPLGDILYYRVVPVHPGIVSEGQELQGIIPSALLIETPGASQQTEDVPFPFNLLPGLLPSDEPETQSPTPTPSLTPTSSLSPTP